MSSNNASKITIAMALSILAAIVGFIPTLLAKGAEWYDPLSKPFFALPGWLFSPAWTLMFLLMAIAFYLVWLKWPAKEAKMAMSLYLASLALSAVWSFLFFGQQNTSGIAFGVAESFILVILMGLTAHRFYQVDRRAGYLMAPCLLWTAYIVCLNAAIFFMNPGA
jgi:tryptophan-rich sensory protein